ncbi:MAG: Rieske 2Fe-2S domain-containing protein [Planctomycetota bacterium]|nr:Rieske 2Fe-2S domain-containing protein [Planctomycetota bacterium]
MTSNVPETSAPPGWELPPATETPRRSMLVHGITAVLSFLIVAVPSTLGGLFFLDPILRKKKSASGGPTDGEVVKKDEAGFIRLDVTKDSIPGDGTPMTVTIKDDLIDAWNMFRDVPIGSIWLRKVGDGPILAFNTICPHLGCSVDYKPAENHFFCPCHTSAFDLDGKKRNEIPPRDMDVLEVSMRTNGEEDANGLEIWVKFQKFQGGKPEKIVI